jgi:hypothetical protein
LNAKNQNLKNDPSETPPSFRYWLLAGAIVLEAAWLILLVVLAVVR